MSEDCAAQPPDAAPLESTGELRKRFDRVFSVELARSPDQLSEALTLRYQVYCCERGFEDAQAFPDDRERDAYDTRAVHALVRHRVSGDCVAAVRLVLGDLDNPEGLFPVEEYCSDALPENGMAALKHVPRGHVAEISRLAVSREIRQGMMQKGDMIAAPEQQVLPYVVVGLFSAIVEWSTQLGITHWMAVMEPASLRLLRRYGIRFCHVGDITHYHGLRKPVVARAQTLVDGIKYNRPEIWHWITDAGSMVPGQEAVALVSDPNVAAFRILPRRRQLWFFMTMLTWPIRMLSRRRAYQSP